MWTQKKSHNDVKMKIKKKSPSNEMFKNKMH